MQIQLNDCIYTNDSAYYALNDKLACLEGDTSIVEPIETLNIIKIARFDRDSEKWKTIFSIYDKKI